MCNIPSEDYYNCLPAAINNKIELEGQEPPAVKTSPDESQGYYKVTNFLYATLENWVQPLCIFHFRKNPICDLSGYGYMFKWFYPYW